MPELIYNIENIFSDSKESCLTEYDVSVYIIGAYQRGYKWDSDENGAVSVLLKDIHEAFNNSKTNRTKEYFLQYITLKRDNERKYFEVIDGQQRLTTLSLLLSILAKKMGQPNIAKHRIVYEIRANFLNDYIYDERVLDQFLELQWDTKIGLTIDDFKTLNTQDVYYLHKASKFIYTYLNALSPDELPGFYTFLLKNVKIIVNVVSHISSEKVFSNMNSNKVALTESELIKGLLLTRYSRISDSESSSPCFKEILDLRISLGRQWDEISLWCNSEEVNEFYFSGVDGMNSILQLVAELKGYKPNTKNEPGSYPLFNFYHSSIKTVEAYEILIKVYSLLKNWYEDDEVYNLLGFLLFGRNSIASMVKYLTLVYNNSIGTRSQLLECLSEDAKKMVRDDTKTLFYKNYQDDEIYNTFLALNVFPPGESIRYNFYKHNQENWTFEHIFPQTPEGKNQVLAEKDKESIISMIGDQITDEIRAVLELPKRDDTSREIYIKVLQASKKLNSMGNMCLLSNKDNISNGCYFFDVKRTNMLNRIRAGSFVPKHTFEVFSKMIFDENPGDPDRWTKENIDNHSSVIQKRIQKIEWYKK